MYKTVSAQITEFSQKKLTSGVSIQIKKHPASTHT